MDFVDVASKLGVPVAMLAFLAFAGWKAGKWIGENLAKPIATSHLHLIETLESNSTTNSQSQARNADSQEKTAEAVATMATALEQAGPAAASAASAAAVAASAAQTAAQVASVAATAAQSAAVTAAQVAAKHGEDLAAIRLHFEKE